MSEIEKKEMPTELIDIIQNHMKHGSKKPEKMPRKLYHATPQMNLTSILKNGLQPHEVFGEIYFCEKLTQCLKFINFRPLIVFVVDTRKLDPEFLYLSADHVKRVGYNFDAYTYFKPISPKFLEWRRIGG